MDEEVRAKYRLAGEITKTARNYGARLIDEGVLLRDVAEKIENLIVNKGAKVAFPVNIAINDIAAHFTPKHNDNLVFKRGDVVKLDVGAHVDGYVGDSAVTIEVGTQHWQDMIKASKEALLVAIDIIRPNINLMLIGDAIERTITSYGFVPICNLTGHSLEQYTLHAGLSIPNIKERTHDKIKEGDVIAIEPFVTNGAGEVRSDKPSNIYRLFRERPVRLESAKILLEHIKNERKGLPFSERWCTRFTKKPNRVLRHLLRAQTIRPYPILKEMKGGIVTQTEHTMIVTEDGCEIIT